MNKDLISRGRRAANAVYLAVRAEVAVDIASILNELCDAVLLAQPDLVEHDPECEECSPAPGKIIFTDAEGHCTACGKLLQTKQVGHNLNANGSFA